MNCSRCGLPLAESIQICPRCGTPTANYPHNAGPTDPTVASSHSQNAGLIDPTVASSYPHSAGPIDPTMASSYPHQQPVSTNYGYEQQQYVPPPPQYPSTPYAPPQVFPEPRPRRNSTALILGIVALLVLLAGGGLLLVSHNSSGGHPTGQVTPTATPTITPTPNPSKNPYPPGTGSLTISDPLNDNSKGYAWNESTTALKGGGDDICSFKNKAYHVTRTIEGSLICPAEAPDLTTLSNITVEASLTVVSGGYSGIAFRINNAQATGYVFGVGVASDYVIDTFNFHAATNNEFAILRKGSNNAIKRGLNQTNVVAIVANGPDINVYINNQFVDRVQDSTYTQGEIGIYAYGQSTADVMANNVRVWSL